MPDIDDYRHPDASRLNNPEAGLASLGTDHSPPAARGKVEYAYNPHLDPVLRFDPTGAADRAAELLAFAGERALTPEERTELQRLLAVHEPWLEWAGKREQPSFVVDPVPLHIHERVSAEACLRAAKRQDIQMSLFAEPELELPQRLEFYRHGVDWSNRLILGDSLQVMASLARREGLAGKVQMIYLDPPYGIKFASNFQPEIGRRDVRDKDEDLTREPEMIRAYRDTWRLGVHSYLSYLRDRLMLCRELLADTGSIFVQISDENVHRVRMVMDEVFGAGNCLSVITVQKTGGQTADYLANVADYCLWYARDAAQVRYRQIHFDKLPGEGHGSGARYNLVDEDGRYFRWTATVSNRPPGSFPVPFEGREWRPSGGFWKTSESGFVRLIGANRIAGGTKTLQYRRFLDDFPAYQISNVWSDVAGTPDKVYVVQTAPAVIQRCLLMTTDPGDLVLDPTCVRAGTGVWVVGEGGGDGRPPCGPPVDGGTRMAVADGGTRMAVADGGTRMGAEGGGTRMALAARPAPSPSTGRAGVGAQMLRPIESLNPGDLVLAHDGQPHRVRRVIARPYRGLMVGLRTAGCDTLLWLTADHLVFAQRRPRTLGGERDWSGSPLVSLSRRRKLRREATHAERVLWTGLREEQLGVKFRRQHALGPYIADFYSRDAHLVVEVDGESHFTDEGLAHDAARTAFLQRLGLDVIRFTNDEVEGQLEGVLAAIADRVRVRMESAEGAEWVPAGWLVEGDLVFGWDGPPVDGGTRSGGASRSTPSPSTGRAGVGAHPLRAIVIDQVLTEPTTETVYDLEVEGAHSFLTEVCCVHNCGSGTTAYVAEQWGRRWITIDTSRVAVAIARQRLLTAKFDYYELRETPTPALPAGGEGGQSGAGGEGGQSGAGGEGAPDALAHSRPPARGGTTGGAASSPACGFVYKSVPHITLKSIAQNTALDPIFAKHEPLLAAAVERCNQALAAALVAAPELRGRLRRKLMEKQQAEGKRAVTDADERRWDLPAGGRWEEWEIPFDTDPDWPAELQAAVTAYRAAWRAKMDEVNACIAANADQEELVDQPKVSRGIVRVSGPFTVEAVQPAELTLDAPTYHEVGFGGEPGEMEGFDTPPQPSPSTGRESGALAEAAAAAADAAPHTRPPVDGGTTGGSVWSVRHVGPASLASSPENVSAFLDRIARLLRLNGVRFLNNTHQSFTRLERIDGDLLHAEGAWESETGERRVAVSIGPEYGPVTAQQVEGALRSANRGGYDDLVFAGFTFDSSSQATIQEYGRDESRPYAGRLRTHLAVISPDTQMEDLLKDRPNESLFTVFGEPRASVERLADGTYRVRMEGVDIYNPVTNEIVSTGADKVAAWFLDTDYDQRSFCICQAFFPDRDAWDKLARALKGTVDEEAFAAFSGTVSLPFSSGEHRRAAVKVIDPRGNEVLKLLDLR